jgi:hypothetical protein
VEEPVKIVDKKEHVLHTKTIPIVKVLWYLNNIPISILDKEIVD